MKKQRQRRFQLQDSYTFLPGIRMWRVRSRWVSWGPYCFSRREAIAEWLRTLWWHYRRRRTV